MWWNHGAGMDGPMRRIILLAIVAALAISACAAPGSDQVSQPPAQPAQVTKIDADQLATMLQNKDFAFVNVHIPYAGEIANTDLQIPYNEMPANLSKLPDKDAKIVLYCRSGRMSDEASQELVKLGYTNVYDVVGGMQAWSASGHELIQK